ncbi:MULTISPECIES: PEP-CTERM sorting domain-containing protein [unclassified Moorena]|uniref:PEP-CTERM sorting domain-containing protein n=1 Tax=unclassified Moorena TaxID=2683338 RepID=UPI0013C932C8|nr:MULTISPECIES: PEP-CTERM sorting domain-containing protein [unclassified Moorena]NEO20624.1 PEP-CTERM sorting domain-containing protein [Moorena sp. SIO4A5]NEQ58597.1 PEP-CTERM sorting domain-containing protein [Moorena sp. SIO4A1]
MKPNLYKTLAVTTTTGAILGLFALVPNLAQAAAMKFEFISTLETLNDNLGFGILRYESAPITGVGVETIQMNQLVGVDLDLKASAEISLDIPGLGLVTDSVVIDESDVVPPSPFLTFTDGILTSFTDTINTRSSTFGVPIVAQALGTTFETFAVDPTSGINILVEKGNIVFSTVPEPGTILGLSLFGLGMLMNRKKSANSN